MTDTITLPRSVLEQALDALKIGHESAHDCAETFHIEMAGYKQQRHEALDAEVKQISDAIGALRAALEQPQVNSPEIPEGWKLVPVEPTTKMIDAARSQSSFPAGVWRAMLAAAPQPPVVEQPQGEQEPAPNGATHRQPKQGAFYKRVDGKWYVWSRMENGEPNRWYISPGTSESCLEPLNAAAPQPPAVKDSLTAEQPQSVTDCHQSQPQGEQEPVAYYVMNGAALFQLFRSKSQADALAYDLQKRHDLSGSPAHFHVVPLYTRPQPRQPLTNEQVKAGLIDSIDFADQRERCAFNLGVRFAESAHGIGGEA